MKYNVKQQILDLFNETPSFNNFIVINNNQIVIDALLDTSIPFIHIFGTKYNGKTHLLKSWVHNINYNTPQHAIYINSKQCINNNIDFVNLLDSYQYIAVDDVNLLSDDAQINLFNLFNMIKLNNLNNKLLSSSALHFDNITNMRHDLRTRLLSGLNLSLKSPNDSEILHILQTYVTQAGIGFSDALLQYLITHHIRNIGVLISIINKIAENAVIENRSITLSLVKKYVDVEL